MVFFWMLYLKLGSNTFEVELLDILLSVVITQSSYRKAVNSEEKAAVLFVTVTHLGVPCGNPCSLSSHCRRCLVGWLVFFLVFFGFFFFGDKVTLCRLGWPGIHDVAQACLKFKAVLSALTSPVLE